MQFCRKNMDFQDQFTLWRWNLLENLWSLWLLFFPLKKTFFTLAICKNLKWKPPEDGSQKLRFPIFVLYDRLQTVIKNISRIVPYIYVGSTILPVPVWLVIGVEWGSRKRVSKKSVLAFSWVSDTLFWPGIHLKNLKGPFTWPNILNKSMVNLVIIHQPKQKKLCVESGQV